MSSQLSVDWNDALKDVSTEENLLVVSPTNAMTREEKMAEMRRAMYGHAASTRKLYFDSSDDEDTPLPISAPSPAKTPEEKREQMRRAMSGLGISPMQLCDSADDGESGIVCTRSKDRALRLIKGHIVDAIASNDSTDKWDFAWSPVQCFNKSMDDILLAFHRMGQR